MDEAKAKLLWQIVRHFEERGVAALPELVGPLLLESLGGDGANFVYARDLAPIVAVAEDQGHLRFADDRVPPALVTIVRHATPPLSADVRSDSRSLEQAFSVLANVVFRLEERDQVPLGAIVKPLLRETRGGIFDEREYGFAKFGEFLAAAEAAGHVVLDHSAHDVVIQTPGGVPSPVGASAADDIRRKSPEPASIPSGMDEAFRLLREAVTDLQDKGKEPFAGAVKSYMQLSSRRAFDEKKLGFGSFGEFLEHAETVGQVHLRHRPGHGRTVTDVFVASPGLEFTDIQFGYSSASAESIRDPRLLLDGFYDPRGVSESLRCGPEFLVLGYKGSGKSSIGEHLYLLRSEDPKLFVDLIDLRDFPIESLITLVGDGSSPQLQQLGWRWLLLVRSFKSLLSDAGAHPADQADCLRLEAQLERHNLLAGRSMRTLSLRSAEMSLSGGLPSLLEGGVAIGADKRRVSLDEANARLLDAVTSFRTDSTHLVVIDGIDELIAVDRDAFWPIASLLTQVDELNSSIFRGASNVKYVLMCRSDLYERVPSPNKNKLRQDFAINLRWHDDSAEGDSDESELLKLVQHRANLAGYEGDDPLGDLLPRYLHAEGGHRRIQLKQFLLEHTRRTPRDLVSLLSAIQRASREGPVRPADCISGLATYSRDYFVPELKDELQGYMTPSDIDAVFGLLGSIGSRVFKSGDISRLGADRGLAKQAMTEALQILFECSALGQERSDRGKGKDHRFRYQYSNLSVNPDLPFIIHRGAWPALSLTDGAD